MERCQVYGAVGLVAGALLFLACGDGKSPVQPGPTVALTPQGFSLSGHVTDTAGRPLVGSRVEVITGPRAGTVTTTDEAGRFSMPGTFTGVITVTASKDGYVPATRAPLRPPPPKAERAETHFNLEPLGPSANIAGVYTLTLTADSACTNLPAAARTRTYTATIVPLYSSTSFLVRLSDARFFSTYNQFGIGIAGDFASIGVWNSDTGIVEQLGETTYLAIGGGAAASFGPSGITAPLDGYFEYCPSETALTGDQYQWCLASAGVTCDSRNHQLTLVRR